MPYVVINRRFRDTNINIEYRMYRSGVVFTIDKNAHKYFCRKEKGEWIGMFVPPELKDDLNTAYEYLQDTNASA